MSSDVRQYRRTILGIGSCGRTSPAASTGRPWPRQPQAGAWASPPAQPLSRPPRTSPRTQRDELLVAADLLSLVVSLPTEERTRFGQLLATELRNEYANSDIINRSFGSTAPPDAAVDALVVAEADRFLARNLPSARRALYQLDRTPGERTVLVYAAGSSTPSLRHSTHRGFPFWVPVTVWMIRSTLRSIRSTFSFSRSTRPVSVATAYDSSPTVFWSPMSFWSSQLQSGNCGGSVRACPFGGSSPFRRRPARSSTAVATLPIGPCAVLHDRHLIDLSAAETHLLPNHHTARCQVPPGSTSRSVRTRSVACRRRTECLPRAERCRPWSTRGHSARLDTAACARQASQSQSFVIRSRIE